MILSISNLALGLSFVFGIAMAEVTHNMTQSQSAVTPVPPYVPNVSANFTSGFQLPSTFPASCEGLIRRDGTFGERGKLMIKEIIGNGTSTPRTNVFFSSGNEIKGLTTYCPQFSTFSDEQKVSFWVATMTIIAQGESGCNPAAKSPSSPAPPYGVTNGEFQTPRIEDGRSPSWRGPGCKEGLGYQTPEHQVGCAIEILGDGLEGQYHDGEPTFVTASGNHWEVLMEKGHSNIRARNQRYFEFFPSCGYDDPSTNEPLSASNP